MIKFTDVSFCYPQKDLYEKISFSIESGEHAALIGSNGSGKTSLLKLIMDPEVHTYEGKIEKDENARIGYVSQFVSHETEPVTVFDYLARPFVALQAKSDELCHAMETGEDFETACELYQKCMDEMEAVDFYDYEVNIRKELAVAGLADAENKYVSEISGGEFKLLAIVGAMLQKPALLIMDEPDVFLDFANLIGLTKLINRYDGTLLAVTHSRLLLNSCFDKILHIENLQLNEFPGNFAEYTRSLLESKIDMQEHFQKFDDFIQTQMDLIEKRRIAADELTDSSKGRQLRARVHYLQRLYVQRGEDPFIEEHNYAFHFPAKQADAEDTSVLSGPVASLENFTLAFDDKTLLTGVSFDIHPGDKVAIVGDNGTGKSSLLNELYRIIAEKGGVSVGFFRQIYDGGSSEKLSGGEQNIAQLNSLSAAPTDVLILDEPTSHLDINAQDALEKAIGEYIGTVIMVSHDFYLVAGCADRIFILENGTLREMSGRAYRKAIYKKYFTSELLEQQRARKQTEMQINSLLAKGRYEDARILLAEL